MRSWYSRRFGRTVHLTHHALYRMAQRGLDHDLVADWIETGSVQEDPHDALGGGRLMKTTYHADDDILEIHISDKPVAREVSHGWNGNISYAEDGSVVEIVLLEAREQGLYPVVMDQVAAEDMSPTTAREAVPTALVRRLIESKRSPAPGTPDRGSPRLGPCADCPGAASSSLRAPHCRPRGPSPDPPTR
jgi:hypothetical protein